MQEIHAHTPVLDTPTSGPQSPRQRIAYLMSYYPGISHTFFLKEILGLKQLGFQVETASVNPPDRPAELLSATEAAEAARTFYLKKLPVGTIMKTMLQIGFRSPGTMARGLRHALHLSRWNLRAGMYALFYLGEALLLGAWMKERGLQHLHVHFGGPVATVGMLTAAAWGFTYSLTIHGPEEFYDVQESYLPQKIEGASFIFCISNFCRSQLMKYSHPSHWSKFQVLRLGVNPDEFKPVPRATRDTTHVICVGRLVPAKGQLVLLQAAARLLSQGHLFHLTFIGTGPDKDHLQQFVDSSALKPYVTFCGALNHEDTRRQLENADIFALPSFAEGVPIALMEAMAMEIPCVSTVIAGIPELIRNDEDGLLVPASSADDLANALQLLLIDEDLRKKLGASARRRVLELYNLPHNLQRLADAFEQCLHPTISQNL